MLIHTTVACTYCVAYITWLYCTVVAGGAVMSLAFIALFSALGYCPCGVQTLLPTVLSTSLVASGVESLPINQILDDNFSVPVITAVMGQFLLHAVQKSNGLL